MPEHPSLYLEKLPCVLSERIVCIQYYPAKLAVNLSRQMSEHLSLHLEKLPRFSDMPAKVHAQSFPTLPLSRAVPARQAHALALSEARVGGKWWQHLKMLNGKKGGEWPRRWGD